jgi:hypothetical protein
VHPAVGAAGSESENHSSSDGESDHVIASWSHRAAPALRRIPADREET